jgi:hypothetical protein
MSETFVRSLLNPRGDNASADEGYLMFNIFVLPCSWFLAFENKSPTTTVKLRIKSQMNYKLEQRKYYIKKKKTEGKSQQAEHTG